MSTLTCRNCGFECKNPMTYCLCLCPYCGKSDRNCRCNQNLMSSRKNLPQKFSNRTSLMQFKDSLIENHIDKGWWRLEKWQVGRSKFP